MFYLHKIYYNNKIIITLQNLYLYLMDDSCEPSLLVLEAVFGEHLFFLSVDVACIQMALASQMQCFVFFSADSKKSETQENFSKDVHYLPG